MIQMLIMWILLVPIIAVAPLALFSFLPEVIWAIMIMI